MKKGEFNQIRNYAKYSAGHIRSTRQFNLYLSLSQRTSNLILSILLLSFRKKTTLQEEWHKSLIIDNPWTNFGHSLFWRRKSGYHNHCHHTWYVPTQTVYEFSPVAWTAWPWSKTTNIPSIRQRLFTHPHGATSQKTLKRAISNFRRGVNEAFAVLGCSATFNGT